MFDNIILMTDSYKVSHWKQYPAGTEIVYSYLEARHDSEFSEVVFFGLSYIMQKYLDGVVVTMEKIDEAENFFRAHFGTDYLFNREGWEYIVREHGGRLPIRINAVAEGTVVPAGNVLMTVENTDPNVPWLTNYVETLLMQVWYPTTVCTLSHRMKAEIEYAMKHTGADMGTLPFKLHDFGYRGSTSVESAGIGGCAHLVNFQGTDTMAALEVARRYYAEPMAGYSIPAAEHSTIISWGPDNERAAYENMLKQFPEGLVAVVSDSYNIYDAVKNLWCGDLAEQVENRTGTVIIRPDSGHPPAVVSEVLRILGEKFGYTLTSTGYKVLPPFVRVIQGDGIDEEMLVEVLNRMMSEKWSIDNIAFGSGGGLLQKVNRDTCSFALKCSAVRINGEWHNVQKVPVSMSSKVSKAGRLSLVKDFTGYFTVREEDCEKYGVDQLDTVFFNGHITFFPTLHAVRERAKA